jgi:hypothetical protein
MREEGETPCDESIWEDENQQKMGAGKKQHLNNQRKCTIGLLRCVIEGRARAGQEKVGREHKKQMRGEDEEERRERGLLCVSSGLFRSAGSGRSSRQLNAAIVENADNGQCQERDLFGR